MRLRVRIAGGICVFCSLWFPNLAGAQPAAGVPAATPTPVALLAEAGVAAEPPPPRQASPAPAATAGVREQEDVVLTLEPPVPVLAGTPENFAALLAQVQSGRNIGFLRSIANGSYFHDHPSPVLGGDLGDAARQQLQDTAVLRLGALGQAGRDCLLEAFSQPPNGIPPGLAGAVLMSSQAGREALLRILENPEALHGPAARCDAATSLSALFGREHDSLAGRLVDALLGAASDPAVSLRSCALNALSALRVRLADAVLLRTITSSLWELLPLETEGFIRSLIVHELAASSPAAELSRFIQLLEAPGDQTASIAALGAFLVHADAIFQSDRTTPSSLWNQVVPVLLQNRSSHPSAAVRREVRVTLAQLGVAALAGAELPPRCGPGLVAQVNQSRLDLAAYFFREALAGLPSTASASVASVLNGQRDPIHCAILQTTSARTALELLAGYEFVIRTTFQNEANLNADDRLRSDLLPIVTELLVLYQRPFPYISDDALAFRDEVRRLLNLCIDELLRSGGYIEPELESLRLDLLWNIDEVLSTRNDPPLAPMPTATPDMTPGLELRNNQRTSSDGRGGAGLGLLGPAEEATPAPTPAAPAVMLPVPDVIPPESANPAASMTPPVAVEAVPALEMTAPMFAPTPSAPGAGPATDVATGTVTLQEVPASLANPAVVFAPAATPTPHASVPGSPFAAPW